MTAEPPTVAFVTIATGRYRSFVAPLLASCRDYFLTDCRVNPIVLTDRPGTLAVETYPAEHAPWPGVTLSKFRLLAGLQERLAGFDYVFLCDVDMRFVAPVGREVLGELVAVIHPAFHDRPAADFTYERRPQSRAFIPPGEGRRYYAGGFVGGRSREFLAACREMHQGIADDLARGLVAVWHDESHLNRYLLARPPTVELSPSYCYPEDAALPFPRRLLALEKNHAAIRHGPLAGLVVRIFRTLRACARRIRHLRLPAA